MENDMRKKVKKIVISAVAFCVLAASLLAFTGCTTAKPDPRGDGVLTIVSTTFAGYDFARQLTKGAPEGTVELILLGKTGQDMHGYEPTAADIITLSSADVLICLGSSVETWLDATLKASMNQTVVRVDMMTVCDTMDAEHDHEHDHGEDDACSLIGEDEHVWLSPSNAILIASAIGDALVEVDTNQKSLWENNKSAYLAELTTLRDDFAAMRAGAVRDVILIADRYPFAYLVRELNLTCHAAFPGCSSETSASFETQTFLIDKTKELALPYIFIIDGSDGKLAGTISDATGAEVLTLHSIQVVTNRESTYIDLMRANLENLKKALY